MPLVESLVPVEESTILEILEKVWNSFLEFELHRSDATVIDRIKDTHSFTGCVQIAGHWEGGVTLSCSGELARQAAASMFGEEPGEANHEEILDALGELANMIRGNLKNILPGSCQLSLPSVTEGREYSINLPGSRSLLHLSFECENQPLVVRHLHARKLRVGSRRFNGRD